MIEPLEISVQGTPNPNAAKFTLNRIVAAQGKTYRLPAPPGGGACLPSPGGDRQAQAGDAAGAEADWVKQLLAIAGVTQVFTVSNFVSVNKAPDADWNAIAPQVERILKQAFA